MNNIVTLTNQGLCNILNSFWLFYFFQYNVKVKYWNWNTKNLNTEFYWCLMNIRILSSRKGHLKVYVLKRVFVSRIVTSFQRRISSGVTGESVTDASHTSTRRDWVQCGAQSVDTIPLSNTRPRWPGQLGRRRALLLWNQWVFQSDADSPCRKEKRTQEFFQISLNTFLYGTITWALVVLLDTWKQ